MQENKYSLKDLAFSKSENQKYFQYFSIEKALLFFSAVVLYFFLHIFFIVVQVQLSPFPHHHSPLPQTFPLPTLDPAPLWFCHVSFTHVSEKPFPLFPPLSPPTSALVTVSLFLISMSLVIFCEKALHLRVLKLQSLNLHLFQEKKLN